MDCFAIHGKSILIVSNIILFVLSKYGVGNGIAATALFKYSG
ncbi:hypothetical protein FH063_003260 [Azospirillum argentinense]|uniref:Uncharacterized protein n=1 Tax=Azospirillum argentinense TaxID=2970906 RepID=A0A5B0KQL4_9PROT|nr:hypothetical protein FH063_003260 [Azospirillum argentinense]